jgi:hypothetical protein
MRLGLAAAGLVTLMGCQVNDNLVAGEGGAAGRGGPADQGGSATGGGSLVAGGTTATGGNGIGGALGAGGTGGLGGSAADFCAGSAKVAVNGKTSAMLATSFEPLTPFDCCWLYALRLHTRESIGVDLEVLVKVGLPMTPGEYFVNEAAYTMMGLGLRTAADSSAMGQYATGRILITGDSSGSPWPAGPWQMGVCLAVNDPSVPLAGAQVYVPPVAMNWDEGTHFALRLLADSTLTVQDVKDLPLDSLALDPNPLLSDSSVSFVEGAGSHVGLDRSKVDGDSLLSSLGQVPVYGRPFVVEAGGTAIYLGAFMTLVSSVAYDVPTVMVENIAPDGFTIVISSSATDPRNDPRIVQALSEIGKYVP